MVLERKKDRRPEYCCAINNGNQVCGGHKSSKRDGTVARLLNELRKMVQKGVLPNDSQSTIFLSKNSALSLENEALYLRYHFICSLLDSGQLLLEKIRGAENLADMVTKVVTIDKLKLCATSVGLQA